MKIRPLVHGDLPFLALLYRELSGEEPDSAGMATVFDEMRRCHDYILLGCDVDGILAGSAMGIVCRQLCRDARPFLVIENFVIAASHRRQGLGLRLLREMERLAAERNCRSIIFVSSQRKKPAHLFYQAAGYSLDEVQGFRKLL